MKCVLGRFTQKSGPWANSSDTKPLSKNVRNDEKIENGHPLKMVLGIIRVQPVKSW